MHEIKTLGWRWMVGIIQGSGHLHVIVFIKPKPMSFTIRKYQMGQLEGILVASKRVIIKHMTPKVKLMNKI